MRSSPDDLRRQEFDAAFQCLYDPLLRRLSLIFGDSFIAEEAVQEAFCRALDRWDELKTIGSLEAWLFVVARNIARDMRRRLSRLSFFSLSEDTDETGPAPQMLPVEEAVEARLTARDVAAAIMKLPPAHREVLFLYYYEGWTIEEIAAATRTRSGTVKSRLYRARQALRAALDDRTSQQEQLGAERREPRERPSLLPWMARR